MQVIYMGCVDLKGSPVADTLDNFFDGYAQGNRGNADVELLEFCPPSTVKLKVRIQHKHKVAGFTVYALTTYVETEFNPFDPNASDVKICADTPFGGKFCITLGQIALIMAGQLAPLVGPRMGLVSGDVTGTLVPVKSILTLE